MSGAPIGPAADREVSGRPPELDLRRLALQFWRGVRLRCPLCGGGARSGWLSIHAVCPRCGLRSDRGESDAFIGGYVVNFVTAELAAALLIGITVALTWPVVPWRALMWGGAALMVALPILFFPHSRSVWLAIDLTFRPPREADFAVRPAPPSTPDAGAG